MNRKVACFAIILAVLGSCFFFLDDPINKDNASPQRRSVAEPKNRPIASKSGSGISAPRNDLPAVQDNLTREEVVKQIESLACVSDFDSLLASIQSLQPLLEIEGAPLAPVLMRKFFAQFVLHNDYITATNIVFGNENKVVNALNLLGLPAHTFRDLEKAIASKAFTSKNIENAIGIFSKKQPTASADRWQAVFTSRMLASPNPVEGLKRLQAEEFSHVRNEAMPMLLSYASERDPQGTAEFFIALDGEADEPSIASDARIVFDEWVRSDPTSASEFIRILPGGPKRDAAILSMVKAISATDPERAEIWINEISSVKLKEMARKQVP